LSHIISLFYIYIVSQLSGSASQFAEAVSQFVTTGGAVQGEVDDHTLVSVPNVFVLPPQVHGMAGAAHTVCAIAFHQVP
jgi:hypothetical protein